MPDTVNEELRDRLLRHQVGLQRLAGGTVNELIAELNRAERQLLKKLEQRIGWIAERGYDASPFTTRRLEANLLEIRKLNAEAYRAIGRRLKASLVDLGEYEADFTERILSGALGQFGAETVAATVSAGSAQFSREFVRNLIESRPFSGGLLKEWTENLSEQSYRRVRTAVRQGLLQGETIPEITRRIRGTRAGRFKDGILEISRREAESVIRTAHQNVASETREEVYRANSDVVKAKTWSATFDSRTCQICAPRDGHVYSLDNEPLDGGPPWDAGPGRIHWQCRCTAIPVVKSAAELGLSKLPGMTGKPADRISYEDWLRGQAKNHPDALEGMMGGRLGPTRAKLIEDGQLSIGELFGNRGEFLTLDRLKKLDRI